MSVVYQRSFATRNIDVGQFGACVVDIVCNVLRGDVFRWIVWARTFKAVGAIFIALVGCAKSQTQWCIFITGKIITTGKGISVLVTDGTPKASGFGFWGNVYKFCAVVVFCHSQDISTKTTFVNVKVCSSGGGGG